jgi:hypothetical protein
MISHGTQIINEKTNTIHIVDEVEVINNETLVFTQDVKCFPLSEVKRYPKSGQKTIEKINSEENESFILSAIKSCDDFPIMSDNLQEIMDNVFKSHGVYNNSQPKKGFFQKIYHFFK